MRACPACWRRQVLGLGFNQLYVEAPVLDVYRTPDGCIPARDYTRDSIVGDVVVAGNSAIRHMPREWRLNLLYIITPEAVLAARGNWAHVVALAGVPGARLKREHRRTALKFKLNINDAGVLLERFGMPSIVRNGKGNSEGRIGWMGSRITFGHATLGGDMEVNLENGQFLKTDPGIGRLMWGGEFAKPAAASGTGLSWCFFR